MKQSEAIQKIFELRDTLANIHINIILDKNRSLPSFSLLYDAWHCFATNLAETRLYLWQLEDVLQKAALLASIEKNYEKELELLKEMVGLVKSQTQEKVEVAGEKVYKTNVLAAEAEEKDQHLLAEQGNLENDLLNIVKKITKAEALLRRLRDKYLSLEKIFVELPLFIPN